MAYRTLFPRGIEMQTIDDLSEKQAEFLLEFCYNMERKVRSSAALAIAMAVARETVLYGKSSTSHKEFGRRIGVCRRSIDTAIKALKRHSLIERIGTTDVGVAIYRANFAECAADDVA